MIPTSALSALAVFLAAGPLTSAAPVHVAASNLTIITAEPAIIGDWTKPISGGSIITGPAFSPKVPAGAVDTHELGVRDDADYTDVRRCPGGGEHALPSPMSLAVQAVLISTRA